MNHHMAVKSQLDTRELLLLESEVKNQGKNMVVAYLLWYFLGLFGAHRFYMNQNGSAIAMLILSVTVIGLIVTSIWWIIDAFLLHSMVKEQNDALEVRLINELLQHRYTL